MSSAKNSVAPVGVFNLYDDCYLTINIAALMTHKHWYDDEDSYMADVYYVKSEVEVNGKTKKIEFRVIDHAPRSFMENWYQEALKRRSAILVGSYADEGEQRYHLPTVEALRKKVQDLRQHSISGAKILIMMGTQHSRGDVKKEEIEAAIKELGNGELADPVQFFELGAGSEIDHALKVRTEVLKFLDKHGVFDGLDEGGMVAAKSNTTTKNAAKSKQSRCILM